MLILSFGVPPNMCILSLFYLSGTPYTACLLTILSDCCIVGNNFNSYIFHCDILSFLIVFMFVRNDHNSACHCHVILKGQYRYDQSRPATGHGISVLV